MAREYDIDDLCETVKDEVREMMNADPDMSFPEDRCHEIADSNVPIYYSEIIKYAAENIDLATDEPECGPAFDGRPTPVNIIAANIYERLSNAAHEALHEWQTAKEEADDFAREIADDYPDQQITDEERAGLLDEAVDNRKPEGFGADVFRKMLDEQVTYHNDRIADEAATEEEAGE